MSIDKLLNSLNNWTTIWLCLALCAVIVGIAPNWFRSPIAEHGKMSNNTASTRRRSEKISKSTKQEEIGKGRGKGEDEVKDVVAHFMALLADFHTAAKVPKQYFTYMYVFCLLCCFIPLYRCALDILGSNNNNNNNNNDNNNGHSVLHMVEWSDVLVGVFVKQTHIVLLALHALRRFIECVNFTIFGRSQMHISGFFVGILHYAMAVGCMCEVEINPNLPRIFRFAA
jgi:hypothetical protein